MSFYFLLAATFCAWTGATMMVAIGGIAFKIVKYYFLSPAGELGDTDGDDDQAVYYVSNEEARKSLSVVWGHLVARDGVPLGAANLAVIFHDMILRKPADPAEDDFGSAYFVDMFFRKRGSDPLHSDPSFLDRITMNNNSIGDGGFLFALKFASQLPDLKTLELTNNGIKLEFGPEEMDRVLSYIKESSITSLDLSGNDFSSLLSLKNFCLLLFELIKKRRIYNLGFSNCSLRDEHCWVLAAVIESPAARGLRSLRVNGNGLSLAAQADLIRAAKLNFSIWDFKGSLEYHPLDNYEDLLTHEVPQQLDESAEFGEELSIYFDAICHRNPRAFQAPASTDDMGGGRWRVSGSSQLRRMVRKEGWGGKRAG